MSFRLVSVVEGIPRIGFRANSGYVYGALYGLAGRMKDCVPIRGHLIFAFPRTSCNMSGI